MKPAKKGLNKYSKSEKQLKKERDRRRKMRKIITESSEHDSFLTQKELANKLGCSQATISRDLKKLGKSRWNPFRLIILKLQREIAYSQMNKHSQFMEQINSLTLPEQLNFISKLILSKSQNHHWYPSNSKPRGRPFTKDWQPRWNRWGEKKIRCKKCGILLKVKIRDSDPRGRTLSFECPKCSQKIYISL